MCVEDINASVDDDCASTVKGVPHDDVVVWAREMCRVRPRRERSVLRREDFFIFDDVGGKYTVCVYIRVSGTTSCFVTRALSFLLDGLQSSEQKGKAIK